LLVVLHAPCMQAVHGSDAGACAGSEPTHLDDAQVRLLALEPELLQVHVGGVQQHLAGGVQVGARQPAALRQLAEHIAVGCKPRERFSIGTEHEKFGFRKADKRPIDYSEVKHLLLGLVNRRVPSVAASAIHTAVAAHRLKRPCHAVSQVRLGAHRREGLHHRRQA
jgi:hypothetical protein